ncbi:hypothetical protein T09_3960 [Trichinella sp. T9]|nr:hypothetical protein T09_3960 [Trichinella sp. T9]KRZ90107.1 hypothetical protein T08_10642 [Trichinella sp. T8]
MEKVQQNTTIRQNSQFADKKSKKHFNISSTDDSGFSSIQVCIFQTHLLETEHESSKKHLNFSSACFAF